jgi:hypothetical protein
MTVRYTMEPRETIRNVEKSVSLPPEHGKFLIRQRGIFAVAHPLQSPTHFWRRPKENLHKHPKPFAHSRPPRVSAGLSHSICSRCFNFSGMVRS